MYYCFRTKAGKVAWTEEQDNEVRLLFEQYQDMSADEKGKLQGSRHGKNWGGGSGITTSGPPPKIKNGIDLNQSPSR